MLEVVSAATGDTAAMEVATAVVGVGTAQPTSIATVGNATRNRVLRVLNTASGEIATIP